ncbi:MAG: DNA recombination protein RmuC [Armatimonadetes bacterium]|nr:DNA recombination protein RmuC [Armatimonadota bacterium]
MEAVYIGIGVLIGAAAIWLLVVKGLQQRATGFQREAKDGQDKLAAAQADVAALNAQIKASENTHKDHIEELKQMRVSAQDAFKVLAENALKENREEFLEGAKRNFKEQREKIEEFVDPLNEKLDEYEEHINRLQKEHAGTSAENRKQIEHLVDELNKHREMATDLKSLLKGPTQRGRVGEMMLKVLLERVGLVEGQHYTMQQTSQVAGQTRRPDCTVFMPNEGRIVIDCKTPLNSYHDAMEQEGEEERTKHLKQHAANVRRDINELNSKQYRDEAVGNSMVVMYLPIESSLAAALYHDPEIMDYGLERNVVLSSPTLLFALLHTVALGWQQERLRESTEEIKALGTELVTRVRIVADHLGSVGKNLEDAVKAYNRAVGSMDRNLLTTARRFQSSGASADTKEINIRNAVVEVRGFDKPELQAPPTKTETDALTHIEDEAAEPVAPDGLPVLEEESQA